MRIYKPEDEEKLRLFSRAAAWRRSALITDSQLQEIRSSAQTDLRRTTVMLRILMFIFTVLLTAATVGFVGWIQHLNSVDEALWWALAAVLSYVTAELLAGRCRFNRHGAEEAFAAGALLLALLSVRHFLDHGAGMSGDALSAAMEALTALGAFVLYARFGFMYMALGGILALAFIPFTLIDGVEAQRIFLSGMLCLGLLLTWRGERAGTPLFRREETSILFASLFLGLCLAVNLRLGTLGQWNPGHALTAGPGVSRVFYWATYLLTFLIPMAGMAAGIKARKRALIIASAAGLILALCTNKDYLGFRHYAWDPAVLGALLIGVSAVLERRLRKERNGYTAQELVSPASGGLEAAALAAGAAGLAPSNPAAGEGGVPFGGGESGGGGATRGF